jgi:hypothetical protein
MDPHSFSKMDHDLLALRKLDPDPHKADADPNHLPVPVSMFEY